MNDRPTSLAPNLGPDADPLLASAAVCVLAGNVSLMTIWRWRKAEILPAPIIIRRRNYWRKSQILAAIEAAVASGTPDGQGCHEVAAIEAAMNSKTPDGQGCHEVAAIEAAMNSKTPDGQGCHEVAS